MTFADDAFIVKAGKCTDSIIKNDIVSIPKWFEFSKLTINSDKCGAMFFGFSKPDNLR